MKRQTLAVAAILVAGQAAASNGTLLTFEPNASGPYLNRVPPATNDWWLADASMHRVNETVLASWRMSAEDTLKNTCGGFFMDSSYMLVSTREFNKRSMFEMLETISRSGDSPVITNTLHRVLIAPTNLYREATFRACVMASPVPMTWLAETVVENIPPAERERWYRAAAAGAWKPQPPLWRRLFGSAPEEPPPLPTRESLRLAHFLHTAKAVETDPACLRAIGDPAAPERKAYAMQPPAYDGPPANITTADILQACLTSKYKERLVTEFLDLPYSYFDEIRPTTHVWWVADDSMKPFYEINEKKYLFPPHKVLSVVRRTLFQKPFCVLEETDAPAADYATKILEALYRSGDIPLATNLLHDALLASTNHYREVTFRACVMAAPVPMTQLAETVVKHIPSATREQWYRNAAADAWRPATFWRREPERTRESLRLAHFLHTAKSIETDRACLKAIGDTADPEREGDQP